MKSLIIRLAAILAGFVALTYHPALNGNQHFSVARSQQSDPDMMAINPNVHAIIHSNNRFALDLYHQLSDAQENIFFSPYSLSNALAMTYAGSAGETAKQMANVLHFNLSADAIHPAFSELANLIQVKPDQGYRIQMANRLWGQENYGFLDKFLTLTQEYYGAGLQELDFETQPEESRQVINQWVAEQTQDTITNLIPEGSFNQTTRLVLTNAIYVQGNWLSPFQPENTKPELFTVVSGEQVTVPMMYQKNRFWYGELNGVKVLRLFYVDYGISMLILLPESVEQLPQLEQNLNSETLESLIECADREYMVDLWLPKFKITAEFELKETLSAMGMEIAFSKEEANFSGMNGNPEDLYLSAVIHKAFVDVNEVGTEAGAGSAVVAGSRSTSPPAIFRADRPFIFLIQDNESDSILFLGRVVNPLN